MRLTFTRIGQELVNQGANITFGEYSLNAIILNLIFSLILVLFIYWIYKRTFTGVLYSKNFNITLVMVSMITSMVVMVISGNLALSLGMVGALSIVRFRAAVKDPKDVAFLFWSITNGIVCGVGAYKLAVVSCLIIAFVVFALSKKIVIHEPYLLVLKSAGAFDKNAVEDILRSGCALYKLRSSAANRERSEMVFEVKTKRGGDAGFVERLRGLKFVDDVSLISYAGDLEEH